MKQFKQKNKGFTLVETLISIFILTMVIAAFMELIANNWFIARFTNNEITANYLAQEALDSIRNDRDTTMFLGNNPLNQPQSRVTFYGRYGVDGRWTTGTLSKCYSVGGCEFDITKFPAIPPAECASSGCTQTLYYDPSPTTGGFYTYTPVTGRTIPTTFIRQVNMTVNGNQKEELNITVKITWKNGTQTRSKLSYYTLMDWQK